MDNMNYDNGRNQNYSLETGYPANGRPVYMESKSPAEPTPGKAIASLILGICSILFCCSGLIGMICAIVDLVLSSQLKKEVSEVPTMGKVGKVLGIIGLILGILVILFWIAYIFILVEYGTWEVNTY